LTCLFPSRRVLSVNSILAAGFAVCFAALFVSDFANAQDAGEPPAPLAEIVEVRVFSDGRGEPKDGLGWAFERRQGVITQCLVLTPWHVVSDRSGVADVDAQGETTVHGAGNLDPGLRASSVARVNPDLDLALLVLETRQGCGFRPPNARLPSTDLAIYGLNEWGGAVPRAGNVERGVFNLDEAGSTAIGFLRQGFSEREFKNGIIGGMSGATVLINGRRAGMVLAAAEGGADRFVFLTVRGIQNALSSEFALFYNGPPNATRPILPKSPIPLMDARDEPAGADVSVAANEKEFRDLSLFTDCEGCPEMVVIPAGDFQMGSPENEQRRSGNEGPQHWVSVERFAIAKTEVTVAEFRSFVRASGYRTDAERNIGQRKGCNTYVDQGGRWLDSGKRLARSGI